MGINKKTRIVVRQGGRDREFASIKQKSDGDLIILLRGEDRQIKLVPIGENPRLIEKRFSIHRSLKSANRGTTIKNTRTFENGSETTTSAFIKNSRDNLLWGFCSYLLPIMENDRYDVSPKKADDVLRLHDEVPPTSCLIVHLYAASPNKQPPLNRFANIAVIQFRFFRIFVYWQFVNLPAAHMAMSHLSMTSLPRVDGVESAENIFGGYDREGMSEGADQPLKIDIEYEIYNRSATVAAMYNIELQKRLRSDGAPDLADQLAAIELWFTPRPMADQPFIPIEGPIYEPRPDFTVAITPEDES